MDLRKEVATPLYRDDDAVPRSKRGLGGLSLDRDWKNLMGLLWKMISCGAFGYRVLEGCKITKSVGSA